MTARFLVWLEANGYPSLVRHLDSQCRANTMTDGTWTQLTGESVQQLWSDYSQNPNQGMSN
jgi:hypothetical protein